MPGQCSRRPLRVTILLLAIGVGCVACLAIAGVLAVLALYLLATM